MSPPVDRCHRRCHRVTTDKRRADQRRRKTRCFSMALGKPEARVAVVARKWKQTGTLEHKVPERFAANLRQIHSTLDMFDLRDSATGDWDCHRGSALGGAVGRYHGYQWMQRADLRDCRLSVARATAEW